MPVAKGGRQPHLAHQQRGLFILEILEELFDRGGVAARSQLPNNIPDAHPERITDDLQSSHGHTLAPGLQPVQMDPIQAGKFGELILREALPRADLLDP